MLQIGDTIVIYSKVNKMSKLIYFLPIVLIAVILTVVSYMKQANKVDLPQNVANQSTYEATGNVEDLANALLADIDSEQSNLATEEEDAANISADSADIEGVMEAYSESQF